MSNLRTNCAFCIFQGKNPSCRLDKTVYMDNSSQFVTGYCSHKRFVPWAMQKKSADPNIGSINDLFDHIQQENNKLSVIIPCLDNDSDALQVTLKNILDNNTNFVHRIVVASTKTSKEFDERTMEVLSLSTPYEWVLEKIVYDGLIEPLGVVNYCAKVNVKNGWFFAINAGDTTPIGVFDIAQDHILDKHQNNVALYLDLQDNIRVFTHRDAFWSLEGHMEVPFLEKMQEFDNWKEVCKQIT